MLKVFFFAPDGPYTRKEMDIRFRKRLHFEIVIPLKVLKGFERDFEGFGGSGEGHAKTSSL
ncbi:hypothetical protein A45J_2694 [hot springs metagenome]|uniref:Uncharacterized protein n=1 Tax=hot springs metagenome TaxID=433727 RepID=A0A5J4L5H3_9ZZZZ